MSITFKKRQKEMSGRKSNGLKQNGVSRKNSPNALQKRRKTRRQQRRPVLNSSQHSWTNYSSVVQ